MKTYLLVLVIAVLMTACNSNPKTSNDTGYMRSESVTDTTGLAAFNAWKAQESLKQTTGRSTNRTPLRHVTRRTSPTTPGRKIEEKDSGSGTLSTVSENAAKAPVKKGWSKAAKGAAIGGASGAIAGAVINKRNRVAGAVIGGIAGAGVGYGVGRTMDKKDGR
jgi:hypothetical protein